MYSQLTNINYNKSLGPITDIRVNDLYIDGDIFPPILGQTGPTGAAGPSFPLDGFSVELSANYTILSGSTNPIPFNAFNVARGGYNAGSIFNVATHVGTIATSGIYIVSAVIGYVHDLSPAAETVTLTINRTGPGNTLATFHLYYDTDDEASLAAVNTVYLSAGDTISCSFVAPFAGDGLQIIQGQSVFSCQRIS